MRPSQARTAREPEAPATVSAASATTRRGHPGRRREATPPPLVLDRYVLRKRLGSGAFGTVWLAGDERLERDVAVKMLPRERIVGGRFEREARVAARLSHPGIVTLYEAAMDDEGAYLVSELVRGATLHQLLGEGRLSDQDIIDIGVALCDALEHAHGQGIVHRDVKPSNILIPEQPASPAQVAKLTDFGVARVVGGDSLTRTGDIIGTLAYMAPEQAEGLEAGPSADLYSLALVLYEALTGVNPVQTAQGMSRSRRLGTYLPPLRRQRRELPRALGSGIDQALRPRAGERGRIIDLRRALVASHDLVGADPGVVGDAWSTLRERDPDPVADSPRPRAATAEGEAPPPAASVWRRRALGALVTAASAAWLCRHALAPAPLPPALLALLCAVAILLLPGLGWLALTAAAAGLAVAEGHPGLVLLIIAAGLAMVVLVPWRPTAWPLPAAAVALGLLGLAGAWPALAAWASSAWRRAALGAAGWVWLLVAAPAAGRALYLDWLPAFPAAAWRGSLRGTVEIVISPLIGSGVLAGAAVWAVGACVLPWLARGRSLVLDALLVVVWAATLVAACTAVIAAVHGAPGTSSAPDAVAGAATGALLALGRAWLPRPAGLAARVPGPWRPRPATPVPDSGVGRGFP